MIWSWKCFGENLVLYSPPIVLLAWAVILAENDRRMPRAMVIIFIVVLAVALAAAETVRLARRKRRQKELHDRDALC
jgi:EamA domain-containing membrane protein RarD